MRNLLLIVGGLIAAFGILFMLQGLGIVNWPKSSFMLGRQAWVTRGAVTAVVGLAIVLFARRSRRVR